MKNLQEMVEKFSGKHKKAFNALCAPVFDTFGISYFFNQMVSSDGQFFSAITNPEYAHFYFEEDLHKANPFIMHPEQVNQGIYIYDAISDEEFQSTLDVVKKKFKFKPSIIFVEKKQGVCWHYGFGIPTHRADIQQLVVNELFLLRKFIEYFKKESLKYFQEGYKNPLTLEIPAQDKPLFAPSIQLEAGDKMQFLSKIGMEEHLLFAKLSKRELECLKHYLQGKSSQEIGKALFVSPRTIETHIENIKNKLSCQKKSDLFQLVNNLRSSGLYPDFLGL